MLPHTLQRWQLSLYQAPAQVYWCGVCLRPVCLEPPPSRAVPADARHGPPPPPAAPTAASLLKEMEAHLCLLYEHPELIERAARHFVALAADAGTDQAAAA